MMAKPTTKGGVIMGSSEKARSSTVRRERERVAARAKANEVEVRTEVKVPMRDGVKLSANVFLPKAEGKFPVILIRSPYGKGDASNGEGLYYAGRGYAVVSQDCRGRGHRRAHGSHLSTKARRAGYICVGPAAAWCNGKVGMLGASYLGWSQYYTAAQRPPHLRCITPIDSSTDFYRDLVYQSGGMFHGPGFMSLWGVNLVNDCFYPGPLEGKLPPMNFLGMFR
jgi:predicted acyl esterase